jgi:uncharacterized membrane protein YhaH (DUF805 family)
MMLNYLYSINNTLKKIFFLSGRSSRREFNIFQLFLFILIVIGFLIKDYVYNSDSLLVVVLFLLYEIFIFLVLINIFLGLSVRRLHDLNISGWFLFVTFIPILGQLLILWLMFKKGTDGVNDYGEPPEY